MKARLAVFAGNLKSSLPKDAGPEIALTTVDTSEMTLSLGYSVGRVMADGEIPQFNAYIMRTIKSLFCGKEAREESASSTITAWLSTWNIPIRVGRQSQNSRCPLDFVPKNRLFFNAIPLKY